MAENKKYNSDTISQQKKARQEFLELKKMQNGQTAIPPPPSAEAVLPKTFKEKSQNFWFYYGKIVVIALIIIIILTVCIAQCVSRVNYDLGVTVYTASPVSDADAKKIAEYLEKYAEDINGDGEVNIQVNNCSYSAESNVQYAQAVNTKIQAIIAADYEAVLFITDNTTYERLNSISDDTGLFEQNGIVLQNDFYEFCDTDDLIGLPHDLNLSLRLISNTTMQKNKKAAICHDAGEKIIQRISKQQ